MLRTVATTLALSALLGRPALAHVQFTATLDGAQEVPPVVTSATATATFTLEGTNLEYAISTPTGLSGSIVAAHVHEGDVGVAGGIVFGIDASTLSGTIPNLSADQIATLFRGGLYVNLHTAANPGGEIRGQIVLESLSGTTCSCKDAASSGAFKRCVKRALAAVDKAERQSADAKALRAAVKKASCGKTKGPKKAVGCCMPRTPVENIVIEPLCAPIPSKACARIAGATEKTSCFPTTPCSPSGAFVDGIE